MGQSLRDEEVGVEEVGTERAELVYGVQVVVGVSGDFEASGMPEAGKFLCDDRAVYGDELYSRFISKSEDVVWRPAGVSI